MGMQINLKEEKYHVWNNATITNHEWKTMNCWYGHAWKSTLASTREKITREYVLLRYFLRISSIFLWKIIQASQNETHTGIDILVAWPRHS